MPQMMPINWLLSFMFFLLVFFLFNILNYYIFNIKLKNKNINLYNKKNKNFIWKW
uniref:ATP synthase complex subunit 8 n=1 Tax=Sinna extrema TaxID=1232046 RepID=A0A5J6N994_9NEOP|nr:ATP synthase F0 subunit 8 [Sinna extrema]QEX51404.1 ATP synthase F0 subunit 8 [Sinna extrema]